MTPRETVMLTRYVKALCPQQAIDEYTPDAWHDLLGHLELTDARAGVIAVASRQPFVAPAEIIAECRRARATQIESERREELMAPCRRQRLHDARPVREQIDAIFAEVGRRELLPASKPAPEVVHPPAHIQHAQLDEWERAQAVVSSGRDTTGTTP